MVPLNLPAPGRRQSIYIDLSSSHGPVFLVNSRFPLFSATTTSSKPVCHQQWSPFSRSYGGILPSSLTTVHPIALVFST